MQSLPGSWEAHLSGKTRAPGVLGCKGPSGPGQREMQSQGRAKCNVGSPEVARDLPHLHLWTPSPRSSHPSPACPLPTPAHVLGTPGRAA